MEVPKPPQGNHVMKELMSAMNVVRNLNHGDLKTFAILVKGKLTRTGTPNEADFVDAIYEAAVELALRVDEEE